MNRNLIITGYKRHGKDTACEYLRDRHGLTFASSSYFAAQKFIFRMLKDEFGYKTVDECFNDRDNHRPLWFRLIAEYNNPDLARLGKEIFERHPVYCGIRNKPELDALKQVVPNLQVVWVDASDRLPPEDSTSMTVTQADAHFIIDNNGLHADLYRQLDQFVVNQWITRKVTQRNVDRLNSPLEIQNLRFS